MPNVDPEVLAALPQVFGLKAIEIDPYKDKDNIENNLMSMNIVDQVEKSRLTVLMIYNRQIHYLMFENHRSGKYDPYWYYEQHDYSKFARA